MDNFTDIYRVYFYR